MNFFKKAFCLAFLMVISVLSSITVSAEILSGINTYKYFTYSINSNNTVSITNCNSDIETAVIPDKINGMTVINIYSSAFTSCKNLKSITVYESNEYFTVQNGILYNKDKTTLIRCPAASGIKTCYIPDTVTTINANAFRDCTQLRFVSVPESVSGIYSNAFLNTNFTSITIKNNSAVLGEQCLGYNENGVISDFTVYGKNDSTALTYATNNNLNFISIDNSQDYKINVNGNLYYHTHQVNFSGANVVITDTSGNSVPYAFSSSPDAINRKFASSLSPVYILDTSGNTITTINVKTAVAGDANLDGKMNIRDAACIASKLAKSESSTEFEKFSADINDDEKADIRDAAAIARILAGNYGN